MHHQANIEPVAVDDDLAERLRCVANELGARGLSLRTIVHALLLEAAERLEAEAQLPRKRDP